MKKYLGSVSLPKKAVPENFDRVVEYYEFSAFDMREAEFTLMAKFKIEYKYMPWIKKFLSQFQTIKGMHDLVYEVVEV